MIEDEEDYYWCHRDSDDDDNFNCDDYMECEGCPYWSCYEDD